jgi:hypothetical protein
MVIVAMLGSGLSLLAAFEWRDMADKVDRLEAVGWTSFLVSASGDDGSGRIDAASCSRVGRLSGVEAVAILSERTEGHFDQLGPRSVPLVSVGFSRGAIDDRILSGATRPTALIGADLVAPLAQSSHLTLSGSAGAGLAIAGVLPNSIGLAGLDGSVVVPLADRQFQGRATECLFRVRPSAVDRLSTIIPSTLRIEGFEAATRQIASSPPRHPYEDFIARPSRLIYLMGSAVGVAAIGLAVRSRSSELGLYRICGTSRVELFLLLGLEISITSAVWIVSAIASSTLVQAIVGLPTMASIRWQYLAISTVYIAAIPIVGRASRRSVVAMLTDR